VITKQFDRSYFYWIIRSNSVMKAAFYLRIGVTGARRDKILRENTPAEKITGALPPPFHRLYESRPSTRRLFIRHNAVMCPTSHSVNSKLYER
jgi:hypothetical protein